MAVTSPAGSGARAPLHDRKNGGPPRVDGETAAAPGIPQRSARAEVRPAVPGDEDRLPAIARRVRLARLEAGLTQATLAGGEISPITVSRIERGVVMPSRRVLAYIAERTGKPLRYFVDTDEAPSTDPLAVDYDLTRARLCALEGDWRRAEQIFADAGDAAASLGDEVRATLAAVGRSTALVHQCWTEAREHALRKALADAERLGLHEVVAWSRLELARVLTDLGRDAEALREVRCVLEGKTLAGEGMRALHVRAAALVALIAERTHETGLAEEAETLLAALDGSEDLTASLSDLEAQSEDAYAHGRIREALDRAREAYRLRSDVAARSAAAEVHYHLAQYYRDLGKYGLALESLLRARLLWRGLGDLVAHAQALTALADTYAALGLLDDAAGALDEARRLLAHAARQSPAPVYSLSLRGSPGALHEGVPGGRGMREREGAGV